MFRIVTLNHCYININEFFLKINYLEKAIKCYPLSNDEESNYLTIYSDFSHDMLRKVFTRIIDLHNIGCKCIYIKEIVDEINGGKNNANSI